MIGLGARKPIDELTLADLEVFPIWEFADDEEALEGRDETWVRPVAARIVDPQRLASLSVASGFTTASGKTLGGFVGLRVAVSAPDELEVAVAVLLANGMYVPAWPTRGRARIHAAARLGLTEEQFFPLRYRLRVHIGDEGTPREGVLDRAPDLPPIL
ncbi:MAG: hypothetical protein FJ091_06935 [Deltaproteobacteria bacterium]|nr:hypothetical protein [Deltaproteobacteria bacterium]